MAQLPKIGLVVEGPTEYASIPKILSRLNATYTNPSCYKGQTVEAPIPALAEKKLLPHVLAQLAKQPDLVIVVIDLESRMVNHEKFRIQLRRELRRRVLEAEDRQTSLLVEVVVCRRTFENWLIADPKGIAKSNLIERDLTNQVTCHADDKDALPLLKRAMRRGVSYKKASHGPRLADCLRVNDGRVRMCSASLRFFIGLVQGV